MKAHRLLKAALWNAVAIALVACSSDDNAPEAQGSLTLALADASVDKVSEIWVELTGVRLQPQSGAAIDVPFTAPLNVDMLTLTSGNTEILLNDETVPAGAYNWMELRVNAEFDNVLDSYVMTDVGGQEEIRVPSGSQTGLRLVSPFTITADNKTSLLIDWDMRMGLTDASGQPGYILRPAFRVIDMTEFGSLSGTVQTALVTDPSCTNDLSADTGNAVYIYDQFDASMQDADDIGGTAGPTPVATARVKQQPSGEYTYEVILSPGDYTVAFTCQAGGDEPDTDEDIAFVTPTDVGVADGSSPAVDF